MRDENMSYTVKSSERLRKSGSEAETKALLYLMNFRPDSDDIYYFVVDFFNDLTGMDNMASRLWDVQSKGAHHVSPKAIGKELVTLFKNYMSPLTFEAYILFIGSVTGSLRKDSSLTTFGIENVKDAAIEQIKLGLHEEGSAKEYIDSTDLTDENINGFLRKVFFVIDDGKKPSEYIISTHSPVILQEVPKNCIWQLYRNNTILRAVRPERETFGENVGVLINDVFGLEVTHSGFHGMLLQMVEAGLTYEEILNKFDFRVGMEARSILRILLANREYGGTE